ncbi:MAG: hypothetical protein VYA84_04520 [Planctomycetota bacterium]|nr:hypothetical protein [Planctomycetota bacterium]
MRFLSRKQSLVFRPQVTWMLFLLLTTLANAMELHNSDRSTLYADKPTVIELFGSDLRDDKHIAARLWTSFPATVEDLDPDSKDRGRVRYKITPTKPISGIVAIRGFNRNEVSQALMFFATKRAGISPPEEHAEPLELPLTIDLRSAALGEQKIPINLQPGIPFVAEILGNRLGSEIDALLVLQTSDGEELAFGDDHLITGSDPILRYESKVGGLHYLTVRDVEYRGGLRMHLRIDTESISGVSFPSALSIGETRSVEVTPIHADTPLTSSIASIPAKSTPGVAGLSLADQLVTVRQTNQTVYVEGDQTVVPIPAIYCGRLSEQNEMDQVSFAAIQGSKIRIDSLIHGGPFIGQIELFRGEQRIAQHHWGLDLNGYLNFTVPKTGLYRLEIKDCLNRTGHGMEYAISIRDDFTPAVLKLGNSKKRKKRRNERPHRIAVDAGESLEMNIRVDRRGVVGPIQLMASLDSVPCSPHAEIDEKKSDVDWAIKIPQTVATPTLMHLEIRGFVQESNRILEIPLDLSEHSARDYKEVTPLPSLVNRIAIVVSPATPGTGNADQKENE